MVAPIKSALDDGLFQLQVLDISGGLNTQTGALSIGANQVPDALNVFSFQGKTLFRGGYSLFSPVANTTDQMFKFFDATGTLHVMIWSAGNLYDVSMGTPVLVAAAVYTAGQQIGVTESNNKMYWTTLTVPMRYYDGAVEGAVVTSGSTGTIATPAGNYLFVYNGQIVILQPVIAGTTYLNSFIWSAVNDPTTIIGADLTEVGSNDGGALQWGLTLGIPAFIIGKTQGASNSNLFIYSGALSPGGFTATPISCPVGALEPNSACVITSKQGLSQVMFIGSDAHFWITNGVEAWNASINILTLTESYIKNALLSNSRQKFFSFYYTRWQYYVCNVGQNYQFVYRPEDNGWWLFQGWPSGPMTAFIAPGSNVGLQGLYAAANSAGQTGVYQIAQDQVGDNGGDITAFFDTPYLHGGKPEREKQFQWVALFTNNVGIEYSIDGYAIPRSDGYVYTMDQISVQDPQLSNGTVLGVGVWNVSQWNNALWGGGYSTIAQPYQPCVNHARIEYSSPGTVWVPTGEKGPLKSPAMQFKIAWAGGVPDFQVLGYSVRYMERSFGFGGNAPGQTQGGIISTTDPFTTTGPS